ncbi:MAG: hypothetical protein LBP37_00305 [Spirochaetaceae bacterium]|nr:hypothetical protein [Spirochaetaceae bacterium]
MRRYLTALAALMFTACLGMETDIDIKQNGSGTINMTYRVADSLFALGTLPGNENAPPVPVGKEDFERTFSRIPGMEMTLYSEKEDGDDRLFIVKAKFDKLDALVSFLDAHGEQAAIEHDNGKTILSLKLDIDGKFIDPELAPILPVIFENYSFDFKISLPRNCEALYTDGDGVEIPALPFGETTFTAKSATFHAPMADLFSGVPASLVIRW